MFFVNFKTYKEATGDNAVRLAIACEHIYETTKIQVVPVVQATDAWRIKQYVHMPIWIQHVDEYGYGQHNGAVTAEAAIQAEVSGILLNHSEHPLQFDTLKRTVDHINSLNIMISYMICAPDTNVLAQAKELSPTYIAYEPPELIASTVDSVATKNSNVITAGVEIADDIPLIVGAGIKAKEDVVASLRRGAKGILVSSAIVTSDKPEEKLHELASAFKSD